MSTPASSSYRKSATMKPETCFALPTGLQRQSQQAKGAYNDEMSAIEEATASRRKQFTRRTSQDLIQLQEAAQLLTSPPPTTRVSGITSENVREHGQAPTHRSILKAPGSGSRSPSPDRHVTFHSDVLIWAAAEDGDLQTVKSLLEAESSDMSSSSTLDVNMSNHENVSLLHLLCFLRDYDAVQMLLNLGANSRVVDREGWTPLHIAVALNLVDIALLLVRNGSDTEFPVDSGVLDLAKVSDGPHVSKLVDQLNTASIVELALTHSA